VRRDDDKPATVRRRLAVYHELTEPLIGFYAGQGRLRSIDGVGAPAEIRRRLAAAITVPYG
jgi:adenylate kinase